MQDAVQFFIAHGSYGLMFAALIAAGMGLPLPEDIVFIAGAVLAQRGLTSLPVTVAVLTLGVFVGDTVLFFLAKRLGPAIYEKRFVRAVISDTRRAWLIDKIARHGSLVVFCARHVAGFRGPTFAIAAIHGISYARFIIADMLALAVSMPIFMAVGFFFANRIDRALEHASQAEWIAAAAIITGVLLAIVIHTVRKIRDQWSVGRPRPGSSDNEH